MPTRCRCSLIAGYAERYGLRAEAIRVTSRDSTSEVGTRERETWIGVTLSTAISLRYNSFGIFRYITRSS